MSAEAVRAGVVCAFVTLGWAGPAAAAEVNASEGRTGVYFNYLAGAGERNDVALTRSGADRTVTLTDRGVTAIQPTGDQYGLQQTLQRCTFVLNTVTCKQVDWVVVTLGDGNDRLRATSDDWIRVWGGPGADSATGPVTFYGGPGPDSLTPAGGGRSEFVYDQDEPGDVTVTLDGVANDGHSGEGDNVLPGSAVRVDAPGNHRLIGSPGNDSLTVYFGNAFLDGGPGDDVLNGSNGADTLVGGAGVDDLRGWGGDDTLYIRDGVRDKSAVCDTGLDTVIADEVDLPIIDTTSVFPCETVVTG